MITNTNQSYAEFNNVLFLNMAITIPTEVAEISTYVFLISKIGILPIDGTWSK